MGSETADAVLAKLERWAEKHPSDTAAQGVDADAIYGLGAALAAKDVEIAALRQRVEDAKLILMAADNLLTQLGQTAATKEMHAQMRTAGLE